MIDIVLLVILLVGFLWGWSKGFLAQLVSLGGALIGFLVACFLYSSLGDFLAPKMGTSPTLGHMIAFFLLWVCVPVACAWFCRGFAGFMKKIKLGWINSSLGGVFSLLKVLLFLSILLTFEGFVDKYKKEPFIETQTKESSLLYSPIQKFAGSLLPSNFLSTADSNGNGK